MLSFFRGAGAPAMIISLVMHAAALGAMAFYKFSTYIAPDPVALETVVADERMQQEFEQDLSLDTTVSENLSAQAGGMVTTAIGAAAMQPVAQTKIEQSEVIKDPDIKVVTIGDISIPGVGEMGLDLGEGEVSGEVGARVEGYGAAMSRVTAEIIRMMRKEPVLVVWMFDASNSLKDDRKEIRDNFDKIYSELKIAQDEAKTRNMKYSSLETMICSFGADIKKLLPNPTADIPAIQKAIDAIADDVSGQEQTFAALSKVMDEFGPLAARTKRKLAVIVVTDESGDDDTALEELIARSEKFRAPVYFMAREAIFGYPWARLRWTNPETKLEYWIKVDRGPETAFPECLQYDGLHGRWDSASSGFGPYGQVRLAKESGGIFFLLSSEEKDLIGRDAKGPRKFDDLAMKEYEPLLDPRREYEAERNKSQFRSTIWQVIVALNPHLDDQLNLKREHFPLEPAAFAKDRDVNSSRCLRSLAKLNEAIKRLEQIQPERAKEREARWRAAYDLCYAQLLSYRVRQFQYLLLLDKHAKENPQVKDPKSNEWYVSNTKDMIEPTEDQVRATKVDMKELEEQRTKAIATYDVVIKEHPGTPWARRAQQEKGWGFGFKMVERFWDPRRYDYSNVPKF